FIHLAVRGLDHHICCSSLPTECHNVAVRQDVPFLVEDDTGARSLSLVATNGKCHDRGRGLGGSFGRWCYIIGAIELWRFLGFLAGCRVRVSVVHCQAACTSTKQACQNHPGQQYWPAKSTRL